MDIEPTQQGGTSIHERLMSALDPTPMEENQIDPSEADSREDTHEAEVVSDSEVEDISEELTEEAETEEESEIEAGESEDGAQYELSDIASIAGIDENKLDVDEDGSLIIRTKIDGVEGTAKLNDLLTSYQLKGHLDNQNQKAVELQKEYQAAKQNIEQAYANKLNEADTLVQMAYQVMMQEQNSVNWDELRADDPAEYSAKVADFQNRQNQIANWYQSIQGERQKLQAESSKQYEQTLAEENAKLVDGKTIPGWDKPDVAQKEYSKVLEYGKTQGYSDESLQSISRHQDVVILRKAMLYDELQGKKPATQKKVKKAPKIARPGQPISKQEVQRKENEAARKRIKSGETGAVANFLLKTGRI